MRIYIFVCAVHHLGGAMGRAIPVSLTYVWALVGWFLQYFNGSSTSSVNYLWLNLLFVQLTNSRWDVQMWTRCYKERPIVVWLFTLAHPSIHAHPSIRAHPSIHAQWRLSVPQWLRHMHRHPIDASMLAFDTIFFIIKLFTLCTFVYVCVHVFVCMQRTCIMCLCVRAHISSMTLILLFPKYSHVKRLFYNAASIYHALLLHFLFQHGCIVEAMDNQSL